MFRRSLGLAAAALVLTVGTTGVAAQSGTGPSPRVLSMQAASGIASGMIQFDSSGPTRIMDTRTGDFGAEPGFTPWIMPRDHVPAEATAILVNLTVIAPQPDTFGFVAVHAGATEWQGTSTVNWDRPGTYSNMALAPINVGLIPPDGSKTAQLLYRGSGRIDLVVDLLGWVVPVSG